jgi:hypothetical protein
LQNFTKSALIIQKFARDFYCPFSFTYAHNLLYKKNSRLQPTVSLLGGDPTFCRLFVSRPKPVLFLVYTLVFSHIFGSYQSSRLTTLHLIASKAFRVSDSPFFTWFGANCQFLSKISLQNKRISVPCFFTTLLLVNVVRKQ